MKAFIDADILIWHLRGERKAINFLRKLVDDPAMELWTGALQRAEVLFFMRPSEEEQTMLLLSQFKTTAVDQAIVDEAGRLFRKWNPSHGVDPNDAILAATALVTGGQIHTLNQKHYPMKDVVVNKAW
ncbi:Ribonuclease VapC19 [Pontiella desulfatans]|uniref:Ribonuclease VapC19 n=1 Tax=Pontiella desulfatans TaxID=2750659 RepID=A0A6C2U4N6_PONDE|nr:type II toxin-antitoxin system VapC family toxin [Pontiella desulfatans]VGO14940.1 Ribonuclease VapC19 [Pontiella desulfatans]